MKIRCMTKFRNGVDTFEEGDLRTVDDERAKNFIDQGWAVEHGLEHHPVESGDVSLDIHSSTHATGDSNG